MPVSINRVWRQLPDETRLSASKVFWAEATKEQKQVIFAALAQAKSVREVSVRRAPLERLVNWTATTPALPDLIVSGLLQDYLLHDHRPVIVRYLDLLAIPHANGMIEDSFDLDSLPKDRIQSAAKTLLETSDRPAAVLYLKYLVIQGDPWSPIEEVLPAGE